MFCSVRSLKFSRLILPVLLVGFCCVGAWAEDGSRTLVEYNRGEAQGQEQVDRVMPASATANSPSAEANSLGELRATTTTSASRRGMAPPTRSRIAAPGLGTNKKSDRNAMSPNSSIGLPKINSFTTAGAGLAIVLGLFFACAWLMRKSGPKPSSLLPNEAVAVLGRVPLAARNFAHLLQVGNKLVLVSVTPDGVTPITEVTDPIEVQRLLGLCLRDSQPSTTVEFHNVLEKLSKEPASGFLGNEAAAAYATQKR